MPKRPTHYGSTRIARATRNRAAWEERRDSAEARRNEAARATERVAELLREAAAAARLDGRERDALAMERKAREREVRAATKRQGGLGL